MRSLRAAGAITTFCLAFTLPIVGLGTRAEAQVCHDGNWNPGEFCGRDAYLVTGEAEMNHDCTVDILDLKLIAEELGLAGPDLSGDLDGDGVVTILIDFLNFFLPSFGLPVLPCTRGGMPADQCAGTIALSFSDNPATIISTRSQAVEQEGTVRIVVDGWTDAAILEYGIETSSNVTILTLWPTEYPYWDPPGLAAICGLDPQHDAALFVEWGGPWPAGPVVFNSLDYVITDANPAWIKLVPVPSCWQNSRIRWAQAAANRSFDFAMILNAGINGPAPPGEPTCQVQPVPALGPPFSWVVAPILLLVAVAVLAGRRRFHA